MYLIKIVFWLKKHVYVANSVTIRLKLVAVCCVKNFCWSNKVYIFNRLVSDKKNRLSCLSPIITWMEHFDWMEHRVVKRILAILLRC
jgi:hypothetical protein